MKFCLPHWEALRAAIKERGLESLIAPSGEAMARRLAAGSGTAAGFEPLMGAHNAILVRLLEIGGLAIMANSDDGTERCPICYANAEHEAHCTGVGCQFTYDSFIASAADDALTEAIRLGLVAKA